MHPLLAVATAALALGCVHRFPSSVALDDPEIEREWRASLFVPPAAIRSQQRVVLSLHGSEIDFSVLVVAREPDLLRVVGLTDLGGTLFQVQRDAAGTRVIQGSPYLDDEFLVDTLVAGLAPIFLGVPDGELQLVRTESGATAMHGRLGKIEVLFAREQDVTALDRFDTGLEGRLRASIRILEWNRAPDGEIRFPGRFTLSDAAGDCRLDFRVIDWRAESPS
jgi:hypothetical protein